MGPPAHSEIDRKLICYLDGEYQRMTREECDERMEKFELECMEEVKTVAKTVEARIKVWILGSLLGIFLAFIGGVIYASISMGSYQEKINQNTLQRERLEQQMTKGFDKLEQSIDHLRERIYPKEAEGRAAP